MKNIGVKDMKSIFFTSQTPQVWSLANKVWLHPENVAVLLNEKWDSDPKKEGFTNQKAGFSSGISDLPPFQRVQTWRFTVNENKI